MTVEIAVLFATLVAMAYFFFTEKLPVDLTAFLGLVVLTLGGYLSPSEAFTGFSSPAVITMLSIFFVSAALLHTGLADMVGGRVERLIGAREVPLIAAIMLVAGILSAFMNNIAAAAVLLPAVASIARKTGISPSRLFMPLSFGAILGGTMTLVGTPPNILTGELLAEHGLEPFALFDFTPLGALLLLLGVVFMITIGRRLLPERTIRSERTGRRELARVYRLHENLFSIQIPHKSGLDGRTLEETEIGSTLGVQVVGILRNGRKHLAPDASARLYGGDVLLVKGRYEELQELFRIRGVEMGEAEPGDLAKASGRMTGAAGRISAGSALLGKTLKETRFRERYGAIVVGIRRGGNLLDKRLGDERIEEEDEIIVVGTQAKIEELAREPGFNIERSGPSALDLLEGHLYLLRVPGGSALIGASLSETRMGELVGLTVVGICRKDEIHIALSPEEKIEAEDELVVAGELSRIRGLLSVGKVELLQDTAETGIESDEVGVVEATLAPRSRAAGKTLADMDFREKHGLQVLALWREGEPIHSGLAGIPLRFGDALLIQGPWNKIRLFGRDPDFVCLAADAHEPRRTKKAPFALGALLLMIGFVITGYQPIHVAAFSAAALVVLARAITMEEAYRAVEWRAVFLVAAILPVGIAMERTGAALLLSQTVTALAGPLGPYAVLAGLFFLSSLLSQSLDGAPAVVLLAPVALRAGAQMGISPYPIMMGIGLAASAAFMTPFSHKANLLVMGAGGYKVKDYLRVGTPLTIILLALLVWLVPVFFPIR